MKDKLMDLCESVKDAILDSWEIIAAVWTGLSFGTLIWGIITYNRNMRQLRSFVADMEKDQ